MYKEIIIDLEFKSLIPPLTQDEYSLLDESIAESRNCYNPLIIWLDSEHNGILIDGYNCYEICNKYDVPFNVEFLDFNSREEAKLWIINNQLGRRNLSDAMKIKLASQKNEYLKALAKENQSRAGGDKAVLTETTKAVDKPINVRKAIANDAGVSEDTVRKYNKIVSEGTPELIRQVENGKIKIGTAYKELYLPKSTQYDKKQDIEPIENFRQDFSNASTKFIGQLKSIVISYNDIWKDDSLCKEADKLIEKFAEEFFELKESVGYQFALAESSPAS